MSVVKDLGFPVKFIGVGEKIDDLRDFEPEVLNSRKEFLTHKNRSLLADISSLAPLLGFCGCIVRE